MMTHLRTSLLAGAACVLALAGCHSTAPESSPSTRQVSASPATRPVLVSQVPALRTDDRPRGKQGEAARSLGMKFVWVRPGSFWMGSFTENEYRQLGESPRNVELTRGFLLGTNEVTVGQFEKFVRATGYITDAELPKQGWSYSQVATGTAGKVAPGQRVKWRVVWGAMKVPGLSWRNPGFTQTADHPVVCVSWRDAQEFCKWLSEKDGRKYRLPTEAEWEYAALGGRSSDALWPEDAGKDEPLANTADRTFIYNVLEPADRRRDWWTAFRWDDKYVFTSPVGSFAANGFRLNDMIGNVMEWCSDVYDPDYRESRDPQGPPRGEERVIKGGSFYHGQDACRPGWRLRLNSTQRYNSLGFRVVCEE